MEDDEEINSDSSSPHPNNSQNNNRITVTVASAPPLQQCLTLALPIQTQKPSSGREDCWSEGATSILIDAWGERYLQLSRGNLKQKHWQEVADIVSSREHHSKTPKTDIQCKNRIDTVKKKYKLEKLKPDSSWPFFHRIHRLIGSGPAKTSSVSISPPVQIRSVRLQNQVKQKQTQTQTQKHPFVSSDDFYSDPESSDSLPPINPKRDRKRAPERDRKRERGKDESVVELTKAILRFGEAYESAERAKMEQMVEMEKQRMKFVKELEVQRMKFFMNTQLEISKMSKNKVRKVNHFTSNGNRSIDHDDDDDDDSSS